MAKKSAASGLQTPPVLAFERKLDPSDALFSAGVWSNIAAAEQWPMVPVREKIVRGTISNRLKNHADAKLDADIENPNLQTVDVAALPQSSRYPASALYPARIARPRDAIGMQLS